MASRFTLGIEEEFQLVDKHTGQLASEIHTILEKAEKVVPSLKEKIKPEMLQAALEIVTDVCPDIGAMRTELYTLVADVAQLVASEGLALVSSGTHPSAYWHNQLRTRNERYAELEEDYQDVARSILIFAVHVHVGVEERELAIPLMNQLRTWLPHFLALSSNSPFWQGRNSGLRSYRAVVWKRFLRSGVPEIFASTGAFDQYVESLIRTGCIDNGKRIWWDIRPHAFFPTLELRVCDMPATLEDTLGIAALWQALIAKLTWMYKHNMTTHVLPTPFIEENKWRAMRYGLDAEFVDFPQNRRMKMRESIGEVLEFVEDVVDELGCQREMNYVRSLLDNPRGTGADRQIAIYRQTGSQQAVAHFLMEQTMEGVVASMERAKEVEDARSAEDVEGVTGRYPKP